MIKNGLWIVIAVTALFLGVLAGFTGRSYYINSKINQVPELVSINNFEKEILGRIKNNKDDKKKLLKYYARDDTKERYKLEKGLDFYKKDMLEIYGILKRNNLLEIVPGITIEDTGSADSGGYGG